MTSLPNHPEPLSGSRGAKMQSLRGEKAKRDFIQNYDNVRVLAYRVLLNGNTRKNQCGGELRDKYYHFIATCKKTSKEEEFFLGYDCAHQVMQMLNISIDSIKLFNPFSEESNNARLSNHSSTNSNNINFTALGKELFCLANLICEGLKLKNMDIIYSVLKKLYENPSKNPPVSDFKTLNTILIKYDKTIQNIIDELQENNKRFKRFDFTKSRKYVEEYLKQKSFNDKIMF